MHGPKSVKSKYHIFPLIALTHFNKAFLMTVKILISKEGQWTFKYNYSRKCLKTLMCSCYGSHVRAALTLIVLMWRIGFAHNNARKWQMGFNSVFKGLIGLESDYEVLK